MRRFTPEEVSELLRKAAEFDNQVAESFSVDDIMLAAEEAGITRASVHKAIAGTAAPLDKRKDRYGKRTTNEALMSLLGLYTRLGVIYIINVWVCVATYSWATVVGGAMHTAGTIAGGLLIGLAAVSVRPRVPPYREVQAHEEVMVQLLEKLRTAEVKDPESFLGVDTDPSCLPRCEP